jgi:hypothetical protein
MISRRMAWSRRPPSPVQAAPLGPEQRDVLVRVGELFLEEQIRLGDDPEHAAVAVHHRHRAHPVLGEQGWVLPRFAPWCHQIAGSV